MSNEADFSMTDNSEHFESLLQIALQKTHVAQQRGSIDVALQWNDIALQLSQSINIHKQGQSDQRNESESDKKGVLSSRDIWWKWWEGIDEIVFLFVGLAYSFIAEIVVNYWHPYYAIALAFCTITGILGYMGFHSYRILSGREGHDWETD